MLHAVRKIQEKVFIWIIESYDFEVVRESGSGPMMVYIP
jgi:hypothetical protein